VKRFIDGVRISVLFQYVQVVYTYMRVFATFGCLTRSGAGSERVPCLPRRLLLYLAHEHFHPAAATHHGRWRSQGIWVRLGKPTA
jgi:hypothetical protein